MLMVFIFMFCILFCFCKDLKPRLRVSFSSLSGFYFGPKGPRSGAAGCEDLPAGEGDPAVAAARFGTPGQALLLRFGQVGGVWRLGHQSDPVGLLVVLQRVSPAP